MLYIITTDDKNLYEWHVGTPIPNVFANEVVSVDADGDELDLILSRITGIPRSDQRIQTWFGDDAKFIYKYLERSPLNTYAMQPL